MRGTLIGAGSAVQGTYAGGRQGCRGARGSGRFWPTPRKDEIPFMANSQLSLAELNWEAQSESSLGGSVLSATWLLCVCKSACNWLLEWI